MTRKSDGFHLDPVVYKGDIWYEITREGKRVTIFKCKKKAKKKWREYVEGAKFASEIKRRAKK